MGNDGSSTEEIDSESQIDPAEGETTQTRADSGLSPSRRSLLGVAGGLGLVTTGLPSLTEPGRAGGKRDDNGDGDDECEPTQTAKLHPDDSEAGDHFGTSIAMDGDTAIISARREDEDGPPFPTAVYVFRRRGDQWTQETTLLSEEGRTDDNFGAPTAVDGDTAVVGAPWDDENGTKSGAAYVFRRKGGQWQQVAKLLADDGGADDRFGGSVDVESDTIIIGAAWDDDDGQYSGSAYVFRREGGQWSQETKLLADDGDEEDQFGFSVEVSGNSAIVGAPWDEEAGDNSGSVYIFRRQEGEWNQESKILAEERSIFFEFGNPVALDGDTAAGGVFGTDAENNESGAVYVYRRRGGQWQEAAKLVADDGGTLRGSIVVDGDTIIVGDYRSESAYIFRRRGGQWRQVARLVADDGNPGDSFGGPIAMDDDTAIVGAPEDDDNGTDSGSAYVFDLCGSSDGSPGEGRDDVETECERYGCECVEVCVSGIESGGPVTAELVYECGECGSDTYIFETDGCHAFTVLDGCTPDCVKFYNGESVEGNEISGTRVDLRDLSC